MVAFVKQAHSHPQLTDGAVQARSEQWEDKRDEEQRAKCNTRAGYSERKCQKDAEYVFDSE